MNPGKLTSRVLTLMSMRPMDSGVPKWSLKENKMHFRCKKQTVPDVRFRGEISSVYNFWIKMITEEP